MAAPYGVRNIKVIGIIKAPFTRWQADPETFICMQIKSPFLIVYAAESTIYMLKLDNTF